MPPNKSKTSFILELLQAENFESKEKERLFGLITEEVREMEGSNEAIRSEVSKIKTQLDGILTNTIDKPESKSENQRIIHHPQKLVNILSRFRRGGDKEKSVLKHTVHDWIVGVDYESYEEFMEILSKEFGKISDDLKSLSFNLHAKCLTFLLNKKVSEGGWGHKDKDKRFRMGWASPELAKWCKDNPTKNPQDFTIPREYREPQDGMRLYKFRDFINQFKFQIEIRDEPEATFRYLIESIFEELKVFENSGVNGDLSHLNLDSSTFYTDVQWLKIILKKIFKQIREKIQDGKGTNKIKLEVIENEVIELRITHIGSFNASKSVKTANKLTYLTGDFEYIRNKIKNLCDWSIETKFKEDAYRLNYLVSDPNIDFKQKIDNCAGFTHILMFYKPSI